MKREGKRKGKENQNQLNAIFERIEGAKGGRARGKGKGKGWKIIITQYQSDFFYA